MGIVLRKDGSNFDSRIKFMKVGEKGYIGRSAIAFDLEGTPYLNVNAGFEKRKDAYNIKIERIGPGEADYHIDIRRVKLSWSVQEIPFQNSNEFDVGNNVQAVALESIVGDYQSKSKPSKANKTNSKERRLKSQLEEAVRQEKYELAAQIRDKLGIKVVSK